MSIRLHGLGDALQGLAALVLALSLTGCGGALQIQGKVVDSRNRPIVGASVDAIRVTGLSNLSDLNQGFSAKSGDKGCFALAGGVSSLPTRQVSLTVSAPGYKAVTAAIRGWSSNQVVITLARKDSRADSGVVIPVGEDGAFPCS